jgi:hypothetical protein
MWHSILCHDSSYVWDLSQHTWWLCSRPGLGAPKTRVWHLFFPWMTRGPRSTDPPSISGTNAAQEPRRASWSLQLNPSPAARELGFGPRAAQVPSYSSPGQRPWDRLATIIPSPNWIASSPAPQPGLPRPRDPLVPISSRPLCISTLPPIPSTNPPECLSRPRTVHKNAGEPWPSYHCTGVTAVRASVWRGENTNSTRVI